MNKSLVTFVTITTNAARQRIDNFLRNRLKDIPKSMIYRIVSQGEVRVNKKRIKPQYKLQIGDQVRIPPMFISKNHKTPVSIELNKIAILNNCIIFEDDYLLVLNKPSGTAVHGGSGLSFGVIEGLRALRPTAKFLELAHRLDRETSGVLLIAKKRSVLLALHEQLRMKSIQKNYLALVRDHWNSHHEVVRVPIQNNILQGGRRIVRVNNIGKPSVTYFKVEEQFTNATLVNAYPITGRTHQIRVHTLYAGHPIAFDNRYGDREFDRILEFTGLDRLFLHAAALYFKHPNTGKYIDIQAPMDENLVNCLKILRNIKI
ncbi:23S rRNA pseudouridine(955/2504/2580) synthase RluC [Candidatus Profftia sp. (ex Adelges kitamiensis)]|uniref:23S rRNA pseudouridine(955/2504/2580) synthase RluC n=1 Tax=Candidatus Profftia sp. (ex Adelges kitamiensis) TaxID=2864218 RepID=UPI001CE24EDA|nr:23S rRNA pseudouridine(955/2504/2580) synthase RluC [Candidatus Profftia sp. (ex Adelges kitamiensis)]